MPLLPVEDEAGVARAGDEFGQGAEGGQDLDAVGCRARCEAGVVVAEDFEDAVGRAEHEERGVVFVDEADVVNPAAGRVAGGEAGEEAVVGEVPDARQSFG